jgi:hypothetical protein
MDSRYSGYIYKPLKTASASSDCGILSSRFAEFGDIQNCSRTFTDLLENRFRGLRISWFGKHLET